MQNYYDDTIISIEKLISEKKYEDAIFLIKAELSAPYVPPGFEQKLNDFENKIREQTLDKMHQTILNETEFEQLLLSNVRSDRMYALTQLDHMNASKLINIFSLFFASDIGTNEEKTMLIIQLKIQNIDFDFKVHKNGVINIVNPSKFLMDYFMGVLKETTFIYEKIMTEKNVTEENYFRELMMTIINYYLPQEVPFGAWELAIGTLKVVNNLMNQTFDEQYYSYEYELNSEHIVQVINLLDKINKNDWS